MATTHAPAPGGSLAHLAATLTPPLSASEIRTLTAPLSRWEKRRKVDVIDVDGILGDPRLSRSSRVMRTVVGSLRALGYDVPWLVSVTGLTAAEMDPPRGTLVPLDNLRMILTVAARIGDRPATPESTGLTPGQIEGVRRDAREQRYFVPACYDERYTYVPGSALELERTTSGCSAAIVASKIRAAADFMRNGGSSGVICREHGFTTRTWARVTDELGIRSTRSGGGHAIVVMPAGGQDQLRTAVCDAERALDAGEDPMRVWALLRQDAEVVKAQVEDAAALDAVAEEVAA